MKKLNVITIHKKYIYCFIITLILIVLLYWISGMFAADYTIVPSSYYDEDNKNGKLAIIIDDFGQSREGVDEMMAIDRHLTFAVLPFMEYSYEDGMKAHEEGFEVIVHLPMEPVNGKRSWLGPRPILCGMSKEEVSTIVEDAFDSVPNASGANIHMGSKACNYEEIMEGILEIVMEEQVYFVDSRTSSKSVAKIVAESMGVICYENNIFLDGQKPKSHIKKQLKKAGEMALERGVAIGIGHVGIEGGVAMAEAIEEMLPEFDKNNIELVFISEIDRDDGIIKSDIYFLVSDDK